MIPAGNLTWLRRLVALMLIVLTPGVHAADTSTNFQSFKINEPSFFGSSTSSGSLGLTAQETSPWKESSRAVTEGTGFIEDTGFAAELGNVFEAYNTLICYNENEQYIRASQLSYYLSQGASSGGCPEEQDGTPVVVTPPSSGGGGGGGRSPFEIILSPSSADFDESIRVFISSNRANAATLFYTTDGSDPRFSSTAIDIASGGWVTFYIDTELRVDGRHNQSWGAEKQGSYNRIQDSSISICFDGTELLVDDTELLSYLDQGATFDACPEVPTTPETQTGSTPPADPESPDVPLGPPDTPAGPPVTPPGQTSQSVQESTQASDTPIETQTSEPLLRDTPVTICYRDEELTVRPSLANYLVRRGGVLGSCSELRPAAGDSQPVAIEMPRDIIELPEDEYGQCESLQQCCFTAEDCEHLQALLEREYTMEEDKNMAFCIYLMSIFLLPLLVALVWIEIRRERDMDRLIHHIDDLEESHHPKKQKRK